MSAGVSDVMIFQHIMTVDSLRRSKDMPPRTNFILSLVSWFRSKILPSTVEPLLEVNPPSPSLCFRLSLLFCTLSIVYVALRFFFIVFPAQAKVASPLYPSTYHVDQIATVPEEPDTAHSSPTSNPPSPSHKQPPDDVVEAFHKFIENDMPARLIDTSNFTFVERKTVFNFFWSEIAQITDEDVISRMCTVTVDTHPEAGVYVTQARRKEALREIIHDVVQYAIFSHHWTNSEPSYQDFSALVSTGGLTLDKQQKDKTAGLAKLEQLCDTARSLGYKLVWSDTCCIDKTNTVELSEAIHAMFRWYAYARVCIVHLGASLKSRKNFELDPWFRRGWTLQELLAPKRIKFYDKAWHPLTDFANDKKDQDLMIALSRVTGIPSDVVVADNSQGVKGHGIWEIMSWASPRKTTRIEDVAYCLFGLFDVNIPILYGEGDKAFPRLLETIVAKHPSWDVFAWAGQASKTQPALPYSPKCYPKWDREMASGELGMMEFSFTPHGLDLTSVPLIPMEFAEEVKQRNGSYTATLRPRTDRERALGKFSEVYVDCGESRLKQIRAATDLHVCILNYKPSLQNRKRGDLQVGRTYVCFLLHMKFRSANRSTWLKFATENVLRIGCTGIPKRMSVDGTFEEKEGVFDLKLKPTRIRGPRAQSTLLT